jgi:hypothetical protein
VRRRDRVEREMETGEAQSGRSSSEDWEVKIGGGTIAAL